MARRRPLGAFVAEALDPSFEGTPFTPGQTGQRWGLTDDSARTTWPSGPGHVVWCAAYDELRQTHPALPQVHDPENEPGWCIDFTVELDAGGRLARADMEIDSLSDTFAMIGMERESQVAAGLIGQDAQAACHVLPELISCPLGSRVGLTEQLGAGPNGGCMHKLMVLYHEPADPDHFRDYYVSNHLPLIMRMPGLLAWRYSFEVAATQGQTPYFAVFEAEFADAAAMSAARASPEGQQVAADVANYATGGAVVIHYPVHNDTT